MLSAVWNKLGARVVPKPSIPVPRCFDKSGSGLRECARGRIHFECKFGAFTPEDAKR